MSKYDMAQWSSVPGRPSFEASGCNSVAVIPLMASPSTHSSSKKRNPNYVNHSEQSFHYLMKSMAKFAKTKLAFGDSPPNSPRLRTPRGTPHGTPHGSSHALEDNDSHHDHNHNSSNSHDNHNNNNNHDNDDHDNASRYSSSSPSKQRSRRDFTRSHSCNDDNISAMTETTANSTAADTQSHPQTSSSSDNNNNSSSSSSSHNNNNNDNDNNSNDNKSHQWKEEHREVILVIPNSHLTRPGDWRYDMTPLSCFDWGKGCQRMKLFDGRPDQSRMAHDRIVNPHITQSWSDLFPSRSTMAVIGVLNCKDCKSTQDLLRAQKELIQWAKWYHPTPYEMTARMTDSSNVLGGSSHGMNMKALSSSALASPSSSSSSDNPNNKHQNNQTQSLTSMENPQQPTLICRMFVFDSFDEQCQSNLDFKRLNTLGSDLVAFPPLHGPHAYMMDQHLNVVVNDLAVAIFRTNEAKITSVDTFAKDSSNIFQKFAAFQMNMNMNVNVNLPLPGLSDSDKLKRDNSGDVSHVSTSSRSQEDTHEKDGKKSKKFDMKNVFDRALNNNTSSSSNNSNSGRGGAGGDRESPSPPPPQASIPHFLFTPLDDIPHDYSKLTTKDMEAMKKQQLGRREKMAGDYCLLAGSPLDAYERFSHAMEMAKHSHDPLWYAASVEGCATAYIAMADAGGHSVDEYLDSHFKLPEEVMNLAIAINPNHPDAKKTVLDRSKTTLPSAILALAEEALGIYCRHPKLAALYAELLLKLAAYTAEKEEAHLHCQWGVGIGCYGGDTTSGGLSRWEHSLKTHLGLGNLGTKGKEYSLQQSLGRSQRFADLLQRAVCAGAIDPRTRADVGVTAARICLLGVKSSHWGDYNNTIIPLLKLPRKAAFYTMIAAEAMTQCALIDTQQKQRATSLWLAVSHLYARDGNGVAGSGNYGWATLRASALHELSQMNHHPNIASEQAAELLILLLSEISPHPTTSKNNALNPSNTMDNDDNSLLPNNSHHSLGDFSESNFSGGGLSGLDLPAYGSGAQGGSAGGAATLSASTREGGINANDKDLGVKSMSKSRRDSKMKNISHKNPFFAQMTPSNFYVSSSKWLENEPIPDIALPLLDPKEKLLEIIANGGSSAAGGGVGGGVITSSRGDGNEMDSSQHSSTLPFYYYNSALLEESSNNANNHNIALSCIVPKVPFETCANAQTRYITNLVDLRTRMPTTSFQKGGQFSIYGPPKPNPNFQQDDTDSTMNKANKKESYAIPPPLHVISASMIKSESNLLLERTKAAGYSGKTVSMSMATFFNPYDNKRKAEEDKKNVNQITLVAAGEERIVVIKFSNLLSVPLEVPSCYLEFDSDGNDKIEAPPLSFTIPAKAKEFAVRFPFIVCASSSSSDDSSESNAHNDNENNTNDDNETNKEDKKSNDNAQDSSDKSNMFELIGVRVTCMNRPYFITFGNTDKDNDKALAISMSTDVHMNKQLPEPASTYPLSQQHYWKQHLKKKDEEVSVKIESVPAQPNLLVSFTTSLTPMHDNATVPVHLSDGEIYTIPPFRLENNFGSSGLGKMERLQIIAVGLPGLQDEILFDTDKEAAEARGEDVYLDSDSEVGGMSEDGFEELMEYDGLPPLKMKANTEGLSLESINEKGKEDGSVVTFQIAATHDMGNSLANGGHVRIRFRYRGPSPNPATEIWRRREISLRILRVKGPRISSLSFRSDLSWGSVFSELSQSLANQRLRRMSQFARSMEIRRSITEFNLNQSSQSVNQSQSDNNAFRQHVENWNKQLQLEDEMDQEPNDDYILNRVGMDQGVHVSDDEVVVLMAVANETSNTIILSNRKGRVGGFEASPMSTVRVTSGVSVKIPVVIQRIDRRDEKGKIADIAAELIARTALQWESEVNESEGEVEVDVDRGSSSKQKEHKRVRHGRVRIPSRCLREIIGEHQSFASRICESPVTVNIDIGRKDNESAVHILPGLFIDALMEVHIRDWIPEHVINQCSLVFEFCCAQKDPCTTTSSSNNNNNNNSNNTDGSNSDPAYVWCGQIRRVVNSKSENVKNALSHRARISFVQSGTFVVSACVKIIAEGHSCEEIWWAPQAETVVVMKMNQ